MSEIVNTHALVALVASIFALGLGPLLYRATRGTGKAVAFLDGLVVAAILCIVVLEILPHSLAAAGWTALLGLGVGIVGPSFAEGRFGMQGTHRAALWVAVLGMALHAITDGLALSAVGVHSGNRAMEYAVVLHRLPVGLAIWWLMVERKAQRSAAPWLVLGAVAAATILGFVLGATKVGGMNESSIGIFEAFVGGLLMHVVSHGVGKPQGKVSPRVAGVGGLVGLAMVGALFWSDGGGASGHEHAHSGTPDFARAFVDIFIESAPALLVAYLLAGLISGVLGEASIRWLSRGNTLQQATRGVVFGLPLPLCSCGVVPVYRSLVRRGVPAAAALAFLVATPELGLDAVLLSLPLLGPKMALVRVAAAFVVALGVGWLVGGLAERGIKSRGGPDAQPSESPQGEPGPDWVASDARPWAERLRRGVASGFGEILDGTGPWIVLGLVIAASLTPWLDREMMAKIPPVAQVGVFAMIGMPLYVCAAGATPMVAVLIAKGLTPGAALAFLLTGPATNATTFGVIKQLNGKKVATAFVGTIVLAAVAMGYGVDLFLADVLESEAAPHEGHEHGVLAQLVACILGGLFVVSFLRQGPRGYLGRLWESGGHAHDHEDDHEHESRSESDDSTSGCCGG